MSEICKILKNWKFSKCFTMCFNGFFQRFMDESDSKTSRESKNIISDHLGTFYNIINFDWKLVQNRYFQPISQQSSKFLTLVKLADSGDFPAGSAESWDHEDNFCTLIFYKIILSGWARKLWKSVKRGFLIKKKTLFRMFRGYPLRN